MTLVEIIRNRQSNKPATATSATGITRAITVLLPVAGVAAVAGGFSSSSESYSDNPREGLTATVIEPAHTTARPIYWEGMDGTWYGPVIPVYLGRTEKGQNKRFWVIVSYEGTLQWIWADLLRSRKEFLAHKG